MHTCPEMPDFLKATAAVNLIQLQAHTSPDRLLSLQQYNQADLKKGLDLTGQVGYTGAMAAQFIAGEVEFEGQFDSLFANPPPGTPRRAARMLRQFQSAHSPHESEHEMAQMPLTRRPTRADAERLMAEGARILNEIDATRSKYNGGAEPTEDGAVVTFQRAFGGTLAETYYSYAAMRANGKWYLTGTMGSIAFTWDELLFWCEEGITQNFHLVTDNAFQPALPASAETPDAVSDEVAQRLAAKGVSVTSVEA